MGDDLDPDWVEKVLHELWTIVPPWNDGPDVGFTVWTMGRQPHRRVMWLPNSPESDATLRHLVRLHNQHVEAMR